MAAIVDASSWAYKTEKWVHIEGKKVRKKCFQILQVQFSGFHLKSHTYFIISFFRVQIYISTIFASKKNSFSYNASSSAANRLGAITPTSTGLKNE